MEIKMKILRNILITSLIMSAFVSLAYAAVKQENETVGSLSGAYGFSSNKQLLLNRARAEAVLADTFDPKKGKSDNAKNAKSFLRSVLLEVVKEFEGRTTPAKDLFLAALEDVSSAGDLVVDITSANFLTANKPKPAMIETAAKLVYDELGVMDPALESLERAVALNIKASTADGKTAESLLAQYDAVKGEPATAKQLLRDVEAMRFGKSGKTLAEKVAARVAKHGAMGKYRAVGVDEGDDDAMGAFHEARRSAREKGAKSGAGLKKTFAVALDFSAKMQEIFTDGVVETTNPIDLSKDVGCAEALNILRGLGTKITSLEALRSKLTRK